MTLRTVPAWAAVLLLLLAQVGGCFDLFDARTNGRLLGVAELPAVTEPIVVIGIDDRTLDAHPKPMILWNPQYAEVVDAAAAAGADVLAFDLLFLSLIGEHQPSAGLPLVSAMARARGGGLEIVNIALGAGDASSEDVPLKMPSRMIQAGSSAVGLANLTHDGDGAIRRQELGCAEPFALTVAVARAAEREVADCATVPIRFRKTAGAWPGPSMQDVLEHHRGGDAAWLKDQLGGRILLLGATSRRLDDHFVTPLLGVDGRLTPGIEVHAHTLHTILSGDAPSPLPAWAVAALMLLLGGGAVWFGASRGPRSGPLLLFALASAWAVVAAGLSTRAGLLPPFGGPLLVVVVPGLAAAMARFAAEREQRRALAATLGSYVNEHVLQALLADPEVAGIHGAERTVTVLMADIVGYSSFSESRDPAEVVGVLNEYFGEMTEAVQDHGGTVDKFIGDGFMAIFGAPLALPADGAPNAVAAARDMERRLERLQEAWVRRGLPELDIGIGVHTGQAVVGNMGSRRKMEFTVIGDAVNVAARIESTTRRFGVRILVSGETMERLTDPPPAADLGGVKVKGRDAEVHMWSLNPRDVSLG